MPRSRVRRIQDSVHGLMEFRGVETVVIDVLRTPELQRLRRIRQLGLAHFVFPGAEHSRLVHSLGAAFLAVRFGRRLQEAARGRYLDVLSPSDSSVRDFAVGALCHDLGHGPLSHAWEREVVGKDYNFQEWVHALGLAGEEDRLEGLEWHELVTQGMLAWEDGQLHQLLESYEKDFSRRLRDMLAGEYYKPYLTRLLDSDIDVDRADYIRRDTHQSGVAYGRYDLDWLVSTCSIGETISGELTVGFDVRKSLRVVEQFLIARQALYEAVYYHKTVRCAEGMVASFLRRLKEVVSEPGDIHASEFVMPLVRIIARQAVGVQELLSLDDFALWVLIEQVVNMSRMDRTVRDLGERILARDLFKLVPCSSHDLEEYLQKPDSHARLCEIVRPYCPGEPSSYLVVDKTEFSMFAGDREVDKWGYFINGEEAEPIRAHDAFVHRWRNEERQTRLFTLAEVIQDVSDEIARH